MALNRIVLEQDGLQVGNNQLVASGGGVTVGRNLVVQGNSYVGTFKLDVNGYSKMPNGLHYQWGQVSANTTAGDIFFLIPYTSNSTVYNVTTTVVSPGANTLSSFVYAVNSVGISVRTNSVNSPANTIVYWSAMGV